MQKVRLIVSGRVQGVGFRYSTYALALEIGDIYGRVWNNLTSLPNWPNLFKKFERDLQNGLR